MIIHLSMIKFWIISSFDQQLVYPLCDYQLFMNKVDNQADKWIIINNYQLWIISLIINLVDKKLINSYPVDEKLIIDK